MNQRERNKMFFLNDIIVNTEIQDTLDKLIKFNEVAQYEITIQKSKNFFAVTTDLIYYN